MIEPVSQWRFVLVLLICVLASTSAAVLVWCILIAGPSTHHLGEGAHAGIQAVECMKKLQEVSSNLQLPADQRASLAQVLGTDLAQAVGKTSMHLTEAAAVFSDPLRLVAGIAAALILAVACGLLWSRGVAAAEHGMVRRLEGIVDGDLRLDPPVQRFSELHLMQRGIRRYLDELRSVTRRDLQLMNEVRDSVRHICTTAAGDTANPATRDQLLAAADKIDELRRISERLRL